MRYTATIVVMACVLISGSSAAAEKTLVITAINELDISRPSTTLEVQWKDILSRYPGFIPDRVELRDADTKKPVVSQNVDLNGDGKEDFLVFQYDFKPNETKKFILQKSVVSMKLRFECMAKTYGRFVPDRYDDYAWESDKTAHRIYGQALMTWDKEPLTSSGVDVWCKSTPNLVVNKWYAGDDYHKDHGEGADFYSVGPNRGCGGIGIWDNQKMHLSQNFKTAKTVANGPVCTIFELTYLPWQANGFKVSEVKRIRIDGGQYLSRFESTFQTVPSQRVMQMAIGIVEVKGGEAASNKEQGWLAYWQPVTAAPGTFLALSVVVDPSYLKEITRDEKHTLAIESVQSGKSAVYHAGGSWTKAGDVATFDAWQSYLTAFSKCAKTPVRVTLSME